MNLYSNGGMREVKNYYVSVQKELVYALKKQLDGTAACTVHVSSRKQKGFLFGGSSVAQVSICFGDICSKSRLAYLRL